MNRRLARITNAKGEFSLSFQVQDGQFLKIRDLQGNHKEKVIALERDGEKGVVMIPLERNPQPSLHLGGRIFDSLGNPVRGIEVQLHLSSDVLFCSCLNWTSTSDEYGLFSFGPVINGSHSVSIRDPEGKFLSKSFSDVSPGGELEVILETKSL